MTAALLIDDLVAGEVLSTVLARIDIQTSVLGRPRPGAKLDELVATLRTQFTDLIAVGEPALEGTRPLAIRPSLEAWLTCDPDANQRVLGTSEVPDPMEASDWLRGRSLSSAHGARRYSPTLDGRALAATIDLGRLALLSADFRAFASSMRPGWVTSQPSRRGRGRPPGVQLFVGTGYALCLELLHRGRGAQVTTADLVEALGLTKTPTLRLIAEAQRRGFLRRSTPRGPLEVRDTERLLDDLVVAVRAESARRPPELFRLRSDRDPAGLAGRVATSLGALGRMFAVTGAAAVAELGGDHLVDAPVRAYANTISVKRELLADAFPDPRNPTLILIEPVGDAVFHRPVLGTPARVSPWQAVIDLLASESEREREIGALVRRRLEAR